MHVSVRFSLRWAIKQSGNVIIHTTFNFPRQLSSPPPGIMLSLPLDIVPDELTTPTLLPQLLQSTYDSDLFLVIPFTEFHNLVDPSK